MMFAVFSHAPKIVLKNAKKELSTRAGGDSLPAVFQP
jgi:hypothetical protein